jgi:pimeloyl-ACP methyl ester carboxylesterase
LNAVAVKPEIDASRAGHPDETGYAERDGVKLYWELQGDGDPTHLFLCPWSISHSRMWKAQVAYLSRHSRTLTFDCKGNGRSDRPHGIDSYRAPEMGKDALAVMDAAGTKRAVVTSISAGAKVVLWLLAHHPDRFGGAIFIAPFLPLTPWAPTEIARRTFEEPRTGRRLARLFAGTLRTLPQLARSRGYRRSYVRFSRRVKLREALVKYNRGYWLKNPAGFVEYNAAILDCNEPHSTKQCEDLIEWGLTADPVAMADSFAALDFDDTAILRDPDEIRAYCSLVRCPVAVIHGEWDVAAPPEWGRAVAKETGGRYLEVPKTGHLPHARRPVIVNLALREFAESLS